ncbi:MAG: cytochrome P450 [Solirubrobacteraceae bacterium]
MIPTNSYTYQSRRSIYRRPRAAANDHRHLPASLPVPAALQTFAFWRTPHAYLEMCRRRLGSTFIINALGKPPMIFMSDPEDIEAIIAARPDVLHPGAGAAVIKPLVGQRSFMLLEEHEHLTVRKAIMPAFHSRVVAEHTDMVRDVAEREVAAWPADGRFAAHPYLRALTLKVILTTIFGSEDPRLDELHTRLLKMLAVTGSLALQEPPLRLLPRWRGVWRSFLSERAHVDRLMRTLIRDEVHGAARERGVLALLLDGQGSRECAMSDGEVRDNLMSVILAGHETTASQLAWAYQLLAHDRNALTTLMDEIDRGGDAYLTATVEEVMRHRPVFLFTIPRLLARPVEVAGRLYQPPGQLVGCIHLMHHDPSLYPEPQRFRPERFVDAPPRPHVWMPWGGGRKRCPGHNLATLEMQTVLRETLKRWVVRPGGRAVETARWRSVIVTPAHGCRIVLHDRTGRRVVGYPQQSTATRT